MDVYLTKTLTSINYHCKNRAVAVQLNLKSFGNSTRKSRASYYSECSPALEQNEPSQFNNFNLTVNQFIITWGEREDEKTNKRYYLRNVYYNKCNGNDKKSFSNHFLTYLILKLVENTWKRWLKFWIFKIGTI